ncbi:hypothetical protein BGW37DRAFT_177357 [Umbelopsis sp. PMI_123]|nr:hypothetical protein BGW37DRAFT_177357 [Umbelopsis sp. PMI_123]
MSSLTSNPIHDNQDAPSILKLLPSLPSPTTWELQNKTAIQLIDDANDYIHGFKHALRVHETERAIHLFLKACRYCMDGISYILLPHHPECAQVQPKSAAFVLLSNLKQSIKETHELVKDIATPLQLIEEAGNIHPSSPNPQLIDNSITSPSPTRPTPVNVETSMDDSNIRLIPPKPTFTPATPIPSSVINANVQALFDEASALFGQLRPLSQNDLSSRAVNPKEDSTKLDTNWIVHRREISEPDIFAAVYEELDTKFNDQNRGNMFVNMETGGGRDVPLFAEKQLPGLPESSTNPALPLRDLEDWMDASYRTVEFDSSMYENQSMRTSSLDINLHLISPIDYDSMIKVDEPHTLSMSPQSPKVLTSLERSNNVDKQKDISNTSKF